MRGSGPLRSSLPKAPPEVESEEEAQRREDGLARRAWRERGVLLLRPGELENEWLRRALEALAVERFGPRRTVGRKGRRRD